MSNRIAELDQTLVTQVITEEAQVTQTRMMLALFKRIRKRLNISGALLPEEVGFIFNQIMAVNSQPKVIVPEGIDVNQVNQ